MSVPQPLRDPDENAARAVQRLSAGMQQGRRSGLAPVRRRSGQRPTQQEQLPWIVIEDPADIAAKSHPYISWDAGA